MRKTILAAVCFLPRVLLAQGDHQWVLTQAAATYEVSHPLHHVEGVSHGVKGKGVCHAGWCDFLIAVPVKSFDSGDSNRDVHMLQVTRGAQFPLVTVRTRLADDASPPATMHADLEIQFAGQTVQYKQIAIERMTQDTEMKITATVPATLTDFKIDPPNLLSIPVKNEIPIHVEMTWRPM